MPDLMLDRPTRRRLVPRFFAEFFRTEAAGGVLLLFCAVLALALANSPLAAWYHHAWEIPVQVGFGGFVLSKSLHHWINDGLMAVFFFVVGLEIKRELLLGELSSARKAALPMAAAVGGMVLPAVIFAVFNRGTASAAGWGIPMATDIAFSLGVLALLGRRVPLSLKVFLTALAIVDDLGAVLVIAFFYTASLSWASLAVAAVAFAVLVGLNRAGVQRPLAYALVGLVLWVAFLKSGVHATVAGVLLATTIPVRRRLDVRSFVQRAGQYVEAVARGGRDGIDRRQAAAIHALEEACEDVQAPLMRLEHGLHPWVAFVIMPVFAFANAGVTLQGNPLALLGSPVVVGIVAGLVGGKLLGVTLFSWLAVRLGLASLPDGVTWRHIMGVAGLCGIGFTMSLFIAGLAFTDPLLLDSAKVGILSASLLAGLAGWWMLARLPAPAGATTQT